jgi:hypothetical protein
MICGNFKAEESHFVYLRIPRHFDH